MNRLSNHESCCRGEHVRLLCKKGSELSIREHESVSVVKTVEIHVHCFGKSYPVHTPNVENGVRELDPRLPIPTFLPGLSPYAEIGGLGRDEEVG